MDFLSEDITKYITVKDIIEEYKRFHSQRDKQGMINPDRMHVEDDARTALLMPAFYENYYAVKLVGVSPSNNEIGKPMVHSTMTLYKRDTMEPLITFDGNKLTGIRTAAIGGLGMKYLAPENATTLGIVGTGVQAWTHLEAALAVRDIHTLFVYSRKEEKVAAFSEKVQEYFPHLKVETPNLTDLIHNAEIIVTATGSSTPVLPEVDPSQWEAKHITAVGSFNPTMQEIPDSILEGIPSIYVDQPTALKESGDMIKASELRGETEFTTIEEVVQKGSMEIDQVNLFKCVGSSIYDLLATKKLYETLPR
ncbi:ornithine cyclodeaminase family protein [Pontibacillus yanchengensis]|uniref:Ornithine cyclodeaminase n=1 Tax=Pontibacillus yanchengensis Y32 TaxID=1385514 RepID=A0A0A2TD50_9BACI|nr:ornithine cyclodeaminase family protein [Pontibacillus yanchengensis]KGP73469.1 hypothetical protein N782_05170 [Pontibacillus yanchengensis Y32]